MIGLNINIPVISLTINGQNIVIKRQRLSDWNKKARHKKNILFTSNKLSVQRYRQGKVKT